MIAQRPPGSAPALQASAEAIPLPTALLTRPWRCSPCTTGPIPSPGWPSADGSRDGAWSCSPGTGGGVRIDPVAVPHGCANSFLADYSRRHAAYLDRQIRASMSNFALPGAPRCEEGLVRLVADVVSGA